jgi:4-amino-4-deoxy-L-arabinose transferase-like glycosyltransferase
MMIRVSKLPWPVERILRVLIAATSILVVMLFIETALRRLHIVYELEQLEGNMFLTALRAFRGQSIYPRPSLSFIPFMYPPVYYYVSAALGRLMGMSISTLRMVSFLSTLGCFAMIYTLVWKESKRFLSGIAGVGLYAGCYTVCQTWFDLGRLDSLFILLVLISMYATRHMHPMVAAIAWTLCFQTKQAILPAAFVMLCYNWKDIKRTLIGVVTLAVAAAGSVAWLNHITEGWYGFYVFEVPKANADLSARTAAVSWSVDLLRPLALACIVLVAAAILTRPSLQSAATRFYLAACSMLPLFWWVRTHSGSTENAPMPIYALTAILFGISLDRLLRWLPSLEPALARNGLLILLLAALAQEGAGIYGPGDFKAQPVMGTMPSLRTLVTDIQAVPGNVYVAEHPYYAWLAGKPVEADVVAMHDALSAASPELRRQLQTELQNAFANHQFSALVLDRQQTSTRKLDNLLGRPEDWHGEFNVQTLIPNVAGETKPGWVLTNCPSGGQQFCAH